MTFSPAPAYSEPDLFSLTSLGRNSYRSGIGAVNTNTAWVANLAIYVPFSINIPVTVIEWFHYNGTLTTAYNVDYGIYNEDLTKVQSLGSTAGLTTASVIVTTTTWTDLLLLPGDYYMAFASDSTRNFQTTADAAGLYEASGIMEQATAFALPSPAVPTVMTRAFCPYFGMNLLSVAP